MMDNSMKSACINSLSKDNTASLLEWMERCNIHLLYRLIVRGNMGPSCRLGWRSSSTWDRNIYQQSPSRNL
ncbi:unnamed protein product [Staurois parvus]|uniref:Uncharacterized protein n=1 Tax=Staurois parvus TaxID=386267 RepID=A0ABN9FNV4_9NEOB|nr:unnamed protein product [Staurois parvus]